MQEQSQQADAFAQLLQHEEKSPATIEKYCRDLQQLTRFLRGRPLSKALLLEYREHLRGRLKPQTVNGKLCSIHAYLKSIGREDCCVKLLNVQRRAFTEGGKELSEAEYHRLLLAAQQKKNERLCMIMETICSTGIRVSELSAITTQAVRAGRAEIALKGKVRVILLPRRLRDALLQYAARRHITCGCIFQTRSGQPLDRSNIWRDMKRLCALARVAPGKVFPHSLRHLFARTYYALEKNLAHLADILGHSSVETTRIYVATSEREHERWLNKMRFIL